MFWQASTAPSIDQRGWGRDLRPQGDGVRRVVVVVPSREGTESGTHLVLAAHDNHANVRVVQLLEVVHDERVGSRVIRSHRCFAFVGHGVSCALEKERSTVRFSRACEGGDHSGGEGA